MNESSLLTIKELARITGVAQSTLRYYDEIGLLAPTTRGENNYRYYHPHQITILNFISVLTYMGVPLATIKELKDNRTPYHILDVLRQQESDLNQQLLELQRAYSIIHTLRDNIQTGLVAQENEISIQELPELPIVLGNDNDFGDYKNWYSAFIAFYEAASQHRINLRYPIGGMHESMDLWLEKPGWPKKFFSMDPLGTEIRPAGKYLTGYTRGYYGQFNGLPDQMKAYATEHNLIFDGPVYNIYIHDEICMVDSSQYLVQVAARLQDKKHSARKT